MDFSSYLSSEQFIHASTAIQTGHPQGLLYVENPSDIAFWRCVVQDVAPNLYVVRPIAKELSAGKRTLEKLYPLLHKSYLVGVDSDFDYICPERHDRAVDLNKNKFVLHTFAYSRESYECCHDAITGLCDILYYHEQLPSEIHGALDAYSQIVYPALCLFAFFHNKDWQQHPDGLFLSAVKNTSGSSFLTDDLTTDYAIIDEVRVKIEQYVNIYQQQVLDHNEYHSFVEVLRERNITEITAYQFIDGHNLQEKIVKPMLVKIRNKSRVNEMAYVNQTYSSEEQKATRVSKVNEIQNHYKKRDLDTLFLTAHGYFRDAIYCQIREKFSVAMND